MKLKYFDAWDDKFRTVYYFQFRGFGRFAFLIVEIIDQIGDVSDMLWNRR